MTRQFSISLQLLAIVCFASSTSAQVVKVNGVVQDIPMLTTFETWGGPDEPHNMEGIEVTVHFSAAPSETETWTGAGFAAPGGGVVGVGGDWQLSNLTPPPTHTFSSPWELSYNAGGGAKGNLIAFEIDGFGKLKNTGVVKGNTAFDTTMPHTGTVNSEAGRDFNVVGNTHDTLATYSDAVKRAVDAAPEGDLYRRLKVEFKGKVDTKWRQPPLPRLGENIHSDIDWRLATTPNGDRQAVADDFISDGRPITGVRWWGSYFDPEFEPKPDPMNQNLVPPIEEGYVISFFESVAGAAEPGKLLGTYAAPVGAVDIQPTSMVGWDQHPVWEYVVDLDQTLLEHESDLAGPEAFHEVADTEYWISIAAENGHEIDVENGETFDNGDDIQTEPWWGWHTTPEAGSHPDFFDENPLVANVSMEGDQWIYAPWNVAPQEHNGPDGFNNMAFELLTVSPNMIGLDGVGDTTMSFYADTDTVVAVPEPSALGLCLGLGMGLILLTTAGRSARARSLV